MLNIAQYSDLIYPWWPCWPGGLHIVTIILTSNLDSRNHWVELLPASYDIWGSTIIVSKCNAQCDTIEVGQTNIKSELVQTNEDIACIKITQQHAPKCSSLTIHYNFCHPHTRHIPAICHNSQWVVSHVTPVMVAWWILDRYWVTPWKLLMWLPQVMYIFSHTKGTYVLPLARILNMIPL